VIADSIGPCDTLDRDYDFVNNETVMLGFPGILFPPDDAFHRLLVHLNESRSDIVLVLFPGVESRKTDMVDIEDSGRVRSIVINPPFSTLTYSWDCAVWRPEFTEFTHTFLLVERAELQARTLLEGRRQSQPDLPLESS